MLMATLSLTGGAWFGLWVAWLAAQARGRVAASA